MLVVVVVAGIALAAGIDALRGGSDPEPRAETEAEPPAVSTAPNQEPPVSETGLGGTLYYTDEGCELQAMELAAQQPVETPSWDECRFVLSLDARRVSGPGSGWDPDSNPNIGRLFQSEGGRIQVSSNRGPEGPPFEGEAPAWRPDGTLTYFADGALRTWPDGTVILSQRDLLQGRRGRTAQLLARFRSVRVREAAWLDHRRLAAILSADGEDLDQDVLAVYEGGRLAEMYLDEPGSLSNLRTSPTGRYIAARASEHDPGGFLLVEPGRGEVGNPGVVAYRAIAWSPNEQWVAVAAEGGVFVFHPGEFGPPALELDLDAQDLDWRGEAGLAVSAETRQWVGARSLAGRLFVTQQGGSGCTLRALDVRSLEWAASLASRPNPCRFTLDYLGAALTETAFPRPGREESAECRDGGLDWRIGADLVERFQGTCAPAWTPDGRLTFVRDGSLYLGGPDNYRRFLLSQRKLSELLGRPSALEEVAWVDDERFWAVVRSGENAIVALLTTKQLLQRDLGDPEAPPGRAELVSSSSFTARMIEGLRVSATGLVAARTDKGLVVFDRRGRRAMTFPDGRAVAWAPGARVAAVATRNDVRFVAPLSREVASIPIVVRDLEWVVP